MAELVAGARFLRSKIVPLLLAASPPWVWTPPGGVSTPRFTFGVAPEGMPYPFVRIDNLSPGNDTRVLNGDHVATNTLWLVKTVTGGSDTTPIEAMSTAIHTALHHTSGSISGGLVLDCWRERPHIRQEVEDGAFYTNLGGEYRVLIQEA